MTATQYWKERVKTPMGRLTLIASKTGLCAVLWQGESWNNTERFESSPPPPFVREAKKQLKEYFAGKRTGFTVPMDPKGTPFQLRAWKALLKIPYGRTASYEAQAKKVGSKNFARAVGNANRNNPLCIFIPCHRVIGKNGNLTGFAAGLDKKEFLLKLEKERVS